MKKAIALILAMALCMAMFAGCTPKESAPSGTDNPTQTPDDSKQPPASDPNEDDYLLLPLPEPTGDKFAGMWGDYGGGVRCALFDRLLQCTPEGEPTIDCLAESHEVSDDGLTYTFKLREGVKWHDGQPFTPEDVAWSIKMALKSTQITSYFLNTFKAIEGAQDYLDGKADEISGIQIDGNTLTIKMAQPSSLMFLTMANWMPYPKHLLEDEPPETLHQADFWEMPVGTGMYKCIEFVPGEYAILERFEDYYGEKPLIKHIKASNYKEGDYVTKCQANELDYCRTRDLSIVNEVLKNPNYTAETVDILYFRYFTINLMGYNGATDGNVLLKDKRVREALLYAMDRESIVKELYPEQGAIMHAFCPTAMPQFNAEARQYEYNPEKAKELLKEANFDFSQTLRIVDYYGDQTTNDLIDTIIYYLDQVGIKASHAFIQGDTTSAIYDKREYDLCYGGFAPASFQETYAVYAGNDPTYAKIRPSGPNDFDPLLEELMQTTDTKRQDELIYQLQEVEREYLWNLPLCTLKNYTLINSGRLDRPGGFGHEWTNYDRSMAKWSLKG